MPDTFTLTIELGNDAMQTALETGQIVVTAGEGSPTARTFAAALA